ncbi:MAG: phosphomannomutase/phosphoglucomutase [Oscillospiraceae bacterium]|nr:phosphomannomutase/phosphoglucomutase [Oscillospiraceae bacterium]
MSTLFSNPEFVNPEFNSMFREYDIRGLVSDNELNDRNVFRIIRAYGRFLRDMDITRAVVGYDNRKCSPGFADAAIRALRSMGIDVIYIGLCISPAVYFAQYHFESPGAVMITASHNPDGWSGFKLGKGYSKTLESDDIRKIYDYTVRDDIPDAPTPGALRTANIWGDYVEAIVSRIQMGPYKPRVVLDAGNGGAGLFAYEVFQRLGCITFQLNCDPDTDYPHYFPNPSNLSARARLREMVTHPYINADIGMGFDGDGDRLGVVDEAGGDIWSDVVLAVLARQLMDKKQGATIVYDVKCSKILQDVIEQGGGIPVMWKTGHSFIKAKMHELKADLAGERSGHIFVGGDDYYGFDDAVFVAAKLAEYLSHKQQSVSSIVAQFPHYVTSPEIKAHCADLEKYAAIDGLVNDLKEAYPGRVNDINGARVQFEHGWGLVRASSNLPEIVLIFEADTKEHLLEIRSVFREATAKYPAIDPNWENDIGN